MFIDGLHTLEELRVERYVVGQGRQFGLYVLGHLLHLGRSIRFEQVEKNTFDPRKQPALTIERHDRIIEGRLGWIVYDRVDFGTRHSDRGIERRSNGGVSCGVFHSASKGLFVSISGSWATGIVWSAHPAAKAVKNVITIFFIG